MLDKSCLAIIILTILALLLVGLILFSKATMASASWCPIKKGTTKEVQDVICYFWKISSDLAFILTIERESGFYPEAKGYNNDGTYDWGLGQLNSRYHSKFINSNPTWVQQAHYVAEVYARASRNGTLSTTFYGYNVREQVRNRFIFFNN